MGGTSLTTSTGRLSPSPSPSPDHRSTPALHSYHGSATSVLDVEGSVSMLRMATTPEPTQYGGGGFPITTGGGGGRPLSQMSFSDDLQTIPSQEVLLYMYSVHNIIRSMCKLILAIISFP
jgi:hypothetical protein